MTESLKLNVLTFHRPGSKQAVWCDFTSTTIIDQLNLCSDNMPCSVISFKCEDVTKKIVHILSLAQKITISMMYF